MQASDYYQKSIVVTGHLSVVMMPLVAGRLVTKQGIQVHRILARLFNTLVTGKIHLHHHHKEAGGNNKK